MIRVLWIAWPFCLGALNFYGYVYWGHQGYLLLLGGILLGIALMNLAALIGESLP